VLSDPYAVWSVSGSAPSVSQGSLLSNGMTWFAGTVRHSA
jgi:hypothetical protein